MLDIKSVKKPAEEGIKRKTCEKDKNETLRGT